MSNHKTLLKGGTVLTLDSKIGNFHEADVLIKGTKIEAVGPKLEGGGAEIIDAKNMIVMPGFIDTHRHLWEGILRNIGVGSSLDDEDGYPPFLKNPLASVYRPEDVYAGNLVSALGAVDAGITTILDWSHIQASPEHTDAAIEALQESGMRAVFAYGPVWYQEPRPDYKDWFRRAAQEHFSSKDQLLTLALAGFGPEFASPEENKADWDLAREVDARIAVHVGVGDFGRQGKVAEVGKMGLYGPDTTFIHCTTLDDNEIQLIADSGSAVSLATSAEMMGHGLVPIQKFLDRGLRPSLSVDVETNAPGDMFTQMRTIISLQHVLLFDRVLAGEWNLPKFLNTRDVIEFATIEGARANGLEDKVGTLTPGKEADLIMLATDRINIMPVNDPIGAVVWGMDTSNVDSVFVAGRALKRNGRLINADLKRIQKLVYESRDYVVKASGFTLPSI